MTVDAISGLLQLASSTLPVGAFSHSLGLEAAFAAGDVDGAASAETWIDDHVQLVWARGEARWWCALHAAWAAPDLDAVQHWNAQAVAARETAELRLECLQTGRSLQQWLLALPSAGTLSDAQRDAVRALRPAAFAAVHALAARALVGDARLGLHALGWSLLENLTMAAVKLLPLGQGAGQAMLRRLAVWLPAALDTAFAAHADEASTFAPMLAIRSAQHEAQYSRLFRS